MSRFQEHLPWAECTDVRESRSVGRLRRGKEGGKSTSPGIGSPSWGGGKGRLWGSSSEALQRSTEVIVGVVGVAGSGQLGRAFLEDKSLSKGRKVATGGLRMSSGRCKEPRWWRKREERGFVGDGAGEAAWGRSRGCEHQLSGSIWKGQTTSHSSPCPQYLAVPHLWTGWTLPLWDFEQVLLSGP